MSLDKPNSGKLSLASPEPEVIVPNDFETQPPMEAQAYEPDDFDFQVDDAAVDYDDDAYEINNEEMGISDDRFNAEAPVYNEIPYAIFFLLVLFVFIIIAIKNLILHWDEFQKQTPWLPGGNVHLSFGIFLLFLFVTFVSFIVAGGIFILTDRYTERVINVGFYAFSYVSVVLGAFALFVNAKFGVLTLSLGVGCLLITRRFEPSIELACIVLPEVFKVLKKYPSTAIFSFVSLVMLVFMEGLFYTVIGTTYIDFGFNADGSHVIDGDGNDVSKASFKLILTILFLSFGKFYISDVLGNVVHTTVAGVYGSWYYMKGTFDGVPINEGVRSLKRACTFSFGTICCGSLFVVFFRLIATMIEVAHFERVGIIGTLLIVIMTVSAMAVGYFNLYVYSYVGIYGKGLMPSFKAIVKFLRQRGLYSARKDVVIVFSMVFWSCVASVIGAFITVIYIGIFGSLLNIDNVSISGSLIYAYILTLEICNVIMATALSGSASFFLALNKDPTVFQESDPFVFQEFGRCYPAVLDRLNIDS